MASPQPDDSHTRISNELFNQIIMRDFTKRQRAIIDFIIRFSYGFGNKTALVPRTKDFCVCGVPDNKVRKELNSLRDAHVIDWNDMSEYWLVKDYEQWDIPKAGETVEERFTELVKLSVARKKHDQNGHDQNGHDDRNGHMDMTETVSKTCPKRSCVLPERPSGTRAEGVPITNDNYKDIDPPPPIYGEKDVFDEIEAHMRSKMVNPNYRLVRNDYNSAKVLVDDGIPLDFILSGIDEAFANYKPRGKLDRLTNFAYCAPQIEQRWNEQNAKHEEGEPHGDGVNRGNNRTKSRAKDDDLAAIEASFIS